MVVVKGAPAPAPGKGVLDQRTCRYLPHVQALPVGSTLEVVNGDPTLHNVHGYLGQATAFNLAMPSKDSRAGAAAQEAGARGGALRRARLDERLRLGGGRARRR